MNCLDTNVLIDYLEGDPAVGAFIEAHENEPMFAPVPAIFEVLVGAARIRGGRASNRPCRTWTGSNPST